MNELQSRRCLLNDIQQFHSVEVNVDHLLKEVFNDVLITDWCQAVGVIYEVNESPDPAFRCNTTLIFKDTLCHDDEL